MVAYLISFYNGYFEIAFGRKKLFDGNVFKNMYVPEKVLLCCLIQQILNLLITKLRHCKHRADTMVIRSTNENQN